ncbi:SWPV1-088 [Shearwaterpox virus]|uniref:SWPV1-088 n=1 Tax=Shearwaterpox virus TaxID=1974596 RepID=A0A1V0S7T6_CNPV|nr:SWPV1-088 [Shearwaterpox virus]
MYQKEYIENKYDKESIIIKELLKLYNENDNLTLRIADLKRRNRDLENKIIKLKSELHNSLQ